MSSAVYDDAICYHIYLQNHAARRLGLILAQNFDHMLKFGKNSVISKYTYSSLSLLQARFWLLDSKS